MKTLSCLWMHKAACFVGVPPPSPYSFILSCSWIGYFQSFFCKLLSHNPLFPLLFSVFINRGRCYSSLGFFSWLPKSSELEAHQNKVMLNCWTPAFWVPGRIPHSLNQITVSIEILCKVITSLKFWGVHLWWKFSILNAKHPKCQLITKSSKGSFHLDVKSKAVWAEKHVPKLWDHLWKF